MDYAYGPLQIVITAVILFGIYAAIYLHAYRKEVKRKKISDKAFREFLRNYNQYVDDDTAKAYSNIIHMDFAERKRKDVDIIEDICHNRLIHDPETGKYKKYWIQTIEDYEKEIRKDKDND